MNTEISEAVAKVNSRKPKTVMLTETPIRITKDAIRVEKAGDLAFTRADDADPNIATLLLFDPAVGAFRPILTPPGSAWELVPKAQGTRLWQPGDRRT